VLRREQPGIARVIVDEPLNFDQAAEFAAGGAAIDDLERQEAEEFGSQQLMSRFVPEGVPLMLDPTHDPRVVAGDFDVGRHEQAVASAEADADLRVVPHQVGDVQIERRQLVDPHRVGFGAFEARHLRLRLAEQGVAEFVEEVHVFSRDQTWSRSAS
jgi:hypothetical protein